MVLKHVQHEGSFGDLHFAILWIEFFKVCYSMDALLADFDQNVKSKGFLVCIRLLFLKTM
jgi:hypothetical protein